MPAFAKQVKDPITNKFDFLGDVFGELALRVSRTVLMMENARAVTDIVMSYLHEQCSVVSGQL